MNNDNKGERIAAVQNALHYQDFSNSLKEAISTCRAKVIPTE